MQLQDTNLYFCTWSFVSEDIRPVHLSTNGTIIIVREELCGNPILDLVLIAFSVTAFTVIVLLFTGAMILRHRRFKKRFTPGRAAGPPRPPRPQHTCPQHQPYLVTSLDFRGTL
ncbi:putative outer membrane usher protein EcpC [Dissostichus eleginoides]|uniref:Outer membrane usher protein EcpC n=1 Tax=Dissostichus eleginoides TaxID=100907 RepID=A0AAD9BD11_DISEL|nr:putative outer membrane usher protein EcpC [Dissostichus eleginoides]